MPLIGFGAVTIVLALILVKAYGTDLAPYIYWMWVGCALYFAGVRVDGITLALSQAVGAVLSAAHTVI